MIGSFTDQPAMPGDEVTSADPNAQIEAADQAGILVPERPVTETPNEVLAMVQHWWAKTSETAAFTSAADQAEIDMVTLMGADPKRGDAKAQVDDAAETTVNHIYRNAVQTVAMCVPENHSVERVPQDMVEPLPGDPLDPQVTAIKRQAQGLGNVLDVLSKRYTQEIDLQEKVEAFTQDACHFRIAILKVMWQGNYETDATSTDRLPDEQDNLARLSHLLEQYHRGEFTKSDWQWEEIRQLMESAGKVQLSVRTGLVIEEVPIDQWRCDPRVTGPEHVYSAEWMRHDILMTRSEILSKWKNINPDDLGHAFVYTLDVSGKRVKQAAIDNTANRNSAGLQTADGRLNNSRSMHDDDLLLVAEIHDATTNQVIVLVEGLEYPATQYPPDHEVDGFFPFVVLVLNRKPRQLYGVSDTELQAKSQAAANRTMSGAESARRAAQPRFVYDTQQIEDKDAQRIANAEPWEMIGLNLGGKDIHTAMMPLVGNHEFNAAEHDPSAHFENMRRMAALPEQALGVTGVAKFSSEVQTAAAGASILAKYRQVRITRALVRLYKMTDQLLLWNVGVDVAVQFAGPLAAKYWPAKRPDRQAIYNGMQVKVKVALDADLDRAKKIDGLTKLFTAASALGVKVPPTSGAKLMAHALGEDEAADLFEPDPNELVGELAQAMQNGGQGALAPEALAALIQIGQQAQQQAAQMAAQAMAQLPQAAHAQAQQIPGQALSDLPAAGAQVAAQVAKGAMQNAGPAPQPQPQASGMHP